MLDDASDSVMLIERCLLSLLNPEQEFTEIIIEGNPHRMQTTDTDIDYWIIKERDWAHPIEFERCIDRQAYWDLQWYPDTPIGFCHLAGSTISASLRWQFPDLPAADITAFDDILNLWSGTKYTLGLNYNEHSLMYPPGVEEREHYYNEYKKINWISAKQRSTALKDNHVWGLTLYWPGDWCRFGARDLADLLFNPQPG